MREREKKKKQKRLKIKLRMMKVLKTPFNCYSISHSAIDIILLKADEASRVMEDAWRIIFIFLYFLLPHTTTLWMIYES